jgi:hypothetical protein
LFGQNPTPETSKKKEWSKDDKYDACDALIVAVVEI